MADLIAKGVQIPDLESGQASAADFAGFIRIFSRNQRLYGRTADGIEHPLTSEGGSDRIFSENVTTPSQVQAGDNAVEFSFGGDIRATYRIGGVDYFPNLGNPYSYRFRDSAGSNFAGLRAPDAVQASYFSMLPESQGAAGQSLVVTGLSGNQQQLGYAMPVKYVAGSPVITPADFDGDRNQIILSGVPAHIKLLDDDGNVRRLFNEDQTNFLYWKAAGTVSGTNAQTIYVQAADPALNADVPDGSIWVQI